MKTNSRGGEGYLIRVMSFIEIFDDDSKRGEAGLVRDWSGVAVDKRW